MIYTRRQGVLFAVALVASLTLWQCKDEGPELNPSEDLTHIPYQPVSYAVEVPSGFPALEQPANNLMTIDGIQLGRKLFYDPILSVDSTISCASCHLQSGSFTDNLDFSEGVSGITPRGSMSLINIGFHYHGLFWDGRSASLEEQALVPVENEIEMGETWGNVERKLRRHESYPAEFRKAFGIAKSDEITRELAAKALAQFERSLISGGNTRYDRFARGEIFLTESEYNGFLMFFDFEPTIPDAECGHCHNAPLFATNDYFNNGLQEAATLLDFSDLGYGAFTGNVSDNGKFKAPTLRNLAFTAPYMHDGRFQTIEEVIDHYNSGGKISPNINSLMHPLQLSESQKADLKAFILTLTDSTALTNPAFQNPF